MPIFSYKNRYIVTPKIQDLYKDSNLQKELAFFVVRNGAKDCASFYDCFRMICAFDHGSLVKDVVTKIKAYNIDEKYNHFLSKKNFKTTSFSISFLKKISAILCFKRLSTSSSRLSYFSR